MKETTSIVDPAVLAVSVSLDEPLDELSADAARSCVKVFEGLAYHPLESKKVEELAKRISRAAKLGATSINVQDLAPTCNLIDYLRDKGFYVEHVYRGALTSRARQFYNSYMQLLGLSGGLYISDRLSNHLSSEEVEAKAIARHEHIMISWDTERPAPPEGLHLTEDEAILSVEPELAAFAESEAAEWAEIRAKYLPNIEPSKETPIVYNPITREASIADQPARKRKGFFERLFDL